MKCLTWSVNKHEFLSLLHFSLSLPLCNPSSRNQPHKATFSETAHFNIPISQTAEPVWDPQPCFPGRINPDLYHQAHHSIWKLHESLPSWDRSPSVILSFHPLSALNSHPITPMVFYLSVSERNGEVSRIACPKGLCLKRREDFICCYLLFSFLQALQLTMCKI